MMGAAIFLAPRSAAEIRAAARLMRDTADRCAASGDTASVSRTTNLVSIAQALEWASGGNNDFSRMISRLDAGDVIRVAAKGRPS